MGRSRKTNRDHAKQQQCPMLEDEVVAAQLEALVTPALIAQERYYRQWQNERANTNSAIDGGGSDRLSSTSVGSISGILGLSTLSGIFFTHAFYPNCTLNLVSLQTLVALKGMLAKVKCCK
jgi:hypothetical protein